MIIQYKDTEVNSESTDLNFIRKICEDIASGDNYAYEHRVFTFKMVFEEYIGVLKQIQFFIEEQVKTLVINSIFNTPPDPIKIKTAEELSFMDSKIFIPDLGHVNLKELKTYKQLPQKEKNR